MQPGDLDLSPDRTLPSEQASALYHPTSQLLDASAKEEGVSLVSWLLCVERVS